MSEASKQTKREQVGSMRLLADLTVKRTQLVQEYKRLPRKSSFSGWALLDEIEALERKIAALKDKSATDVDHSRALTPAHQQQEKSNDQR